MKKIWKSALLLPVILLLLLSACGKPEPPQPTAGPSAAPGEAPVPAADTRYLRYDVTEEAQFDLSYEDHFFTETELILLGKRKGATLLLRVPLAGGDAAELPLDKAYKQAAAGPGCLWLGDRMELVRLDAAGQQTLSLTFPEMIEDLFCDETGRLYVAHRNSLTLVSDSGEKESISFPKDYTGGSLLRLGSGEIAVFASRIKGPVARLQRVSSGALVPLDVGDANIGVLASGDAGADFYYLESNYMDLLSEASRVFRFSGGASTPIFDLAGTSREGKVRGFRPQGADFLLVYGGDEGTGLLRFTPTEAEKKILTVARLNNNHYITELINRFNRENPEYYLINRFYLGLDTEMMTEMLELDILAGDRPDLLDTMLTNLEVYGAKGLLRDLYPMIDADPTISREDLVPSVLHAMETESGALYRLWPTFTLYSSCGSAAYVGDAEGWTPEDMYRIMEENPELILFGRSNDGARALLNWTLTGVMDRFADFETGELRFDTPEFVEYLAFLREMVERVRNYDGGDTLLGVLGAGSASAFARGVTNAELADLRIIGFPTWEGTGLRCTGLYSFSVFDGTGNEEDAWAFIRWLLSEELQEEAGGLPMRRSVLEAQLEEIRNGAPETTVTQFVDPIAAASGTNTETVTYTLPAVPPLTEEQFTAIRRLLDGIDGVYEDTIGHPCYFIIWEECVNLFKDAKTPEETARAIQDRLTIYLAERAS